MLKSQPLGAGFLRDRRPTSILLLASALFGWTSCSTPRQKVDSDIVRKVHMRGNCADSEGREGWWKRSAFKCETPGTVVVAQMEQPASPAGIAVPVINRLLKPEELKFGALERDSYRLEVWFAHSGYFDTRFEGWEVHRRKPTVTWKSDGKLLFGSKHNAGQVRKAGVIDIVGHVDRGEVSTVRSIEIIGHQKEADPIVNLVRRELLLNEGDPFVLENVEIARAGLQAKLQERGYAYAQAYLVTEAHPEDNAVDVRLVLDMGRQRSSRFGDITFVGVDLTPEDKLENLVDFKAGDPYRISKLEDSRSALFNTSAFSVVNVEPDLSVRGQDPVPVQIEVAETSFRSWRLGMGAEWDGYTLTLPLSARFRNVNLFHELVRFELAGSVGYTSRSTGGAVLRKTNSLLELTDQMVYDAEMNMTWPQLFGRRVDGSLVAKVQRDLLNGQFLFTNPELDIGMIYRIDRYWTLSFGPHAELYTMPALLAGSSTPEQRASAAALFGFGFDGRFSLTTLDAHLTVDWRNDPVAPTDGSYWDLAVRQAFPFTSDDFTYTDIAAEVRDFERLSFIGPDWVVAGRLKGRVLIPYGPRRSGTIVDSRLPYPERVFMGGQSDVRAFRDGQVGPYDLLCLYSPDGVGDPFSGFQGRGLDGSQRYLPRGGSAGGVVSTEVRGPLSPAYDVGQQFFFDVGAFNTEVVGGSRGVVRWGGGWGVSYDSLVGPIRIDLAFRPVFVEDIQPVRSVNCRRDDVLARPYGLFTNRDSRGKDDIVVRGARYENPRNPVGQIQLTIGHPF